MTTSIITSKGWDEATLSNPALHWIHEHNESFTKNDREGCYRYYAPDMTYVRGNGHSFTGTEAHSAVMDDYSLPKSFTIEPVYNVITENPDGGCHLFCQAEMFADLPGESGEKKFTDAQGKQWETKMHVVYVGDIAKDPNGPGGYRMKYMQSYNDPTPLLAEAIKRGVVPPSVLLG